MGDETFPSELAAKLRDARRAFLDAAVPLRPALFAYCRSLTGDLWDAEDLVQETLLRAFARLPELHFRVGSWKAYLFRAATNTFISARRRRREAEWPEDHDAAAGAEPPERPLEVREALGELARRLPPRERVAVLLKDVFEFPLATIAAWLETSTGAVKAALSRGRGKLGGEAPAHRSPASGGPPRDLLDRWCAAFNSRDLPALTSLLAEEATAEVVGVVLEHGRERIRDGSLHHTLFLEEGEPRAEVREFSGERLVVLWYEAEAGRVVRDVLRFVAVAERIRAFRYYFYCPETLAEVTAELGVPLADNGYFYVPSGS